MASNAASREIGEIAPPRRSSILERFRGSISSQPHIAKLEAGRAKNIELHTLCRWATALGAKLSVEVVPNGARNRKRPGA